MTITLAADVEEFIRDQVRSGVCTDPEQLLNNVIRSFRDQQTISFGMNSEMEAWLLEAADDPSDRLTKKDFAAIRLRVRERMSTAS